MNVSRLSVIDVSAAAVPMDPPVGIQPDQKALSALYALAAPSVSVIRLYAQAMQVAGPSDGDAESLHQLRVATRRLRALLWAYAPLLDASQRAEADKQLKALADIAGHTRDWDVLLTQLATKNRPPSTSRRRAKRLRHAARARRDAALTASHDALLVSDVDRAVSLFAMSPPNDAIERAERGDAPVDDADRVTVSALAAQALPRAAAQIAARAHRVSKAAKALKASGEHARPDHASRHVNGAKARKHANGVLVSLHRTRVAIKKLRYLSDLFAPVLNLSPKALARQSDALTKLQTRLGQVNDRRACAEMVDREWIAASRAEARYRDTKPRALSASDLSPPDRAAAKTLRTYLQRAADRRSRRAVAALQRAARHKVLSKKYWRKAVDVDDAGITDNADIAGGADNVRNVKAGTRTDRRTASAGKNGRATASATSDETSGLPRI